ncbi:DUF1133 family protein [Pectobacterium brasiliense]|uniref:DUF1133 family protein n=1 Tax=Pectobacterium brasiliense TaxID=180957 RepID=UPI003B28051D
MKKSAITAQDIETAIWLLCKSGCTSNELEFWLFQMQRESATSSLVFCTEAESGLMDRMIC